MTGMTQGTVSVHGGLEEWSLEQEAYHDKDRAANKQQN